MTKFRVNGNHGFVGVEGVPTLLAEHDVYDGEHELVQARPELFDEVPEPVKRPVLGRPRKDAEEAPRR